MCADLSAVTRALKENSPIAVHQETQRIAVLLSADPENCFNGLDGELYYGLGQKYFWECREIFSEAEEVARPAKFWLELKKA